LDRITVETKAKGLRSTFPLLIHVTPLAKSAHPALLFFGLELAILFKRREHFTRFSFPTENYIFNSTYNHLFTLDLWSTFSALVYVLFKMSVARRKIANKSADGVATRECCSLVMPIW